MSEALFESDFAEVSSKEWIDKIIKDLRGTPYDKLIWHLDDHTQIDPYYTIERDHSLDATIHQTILNQLQGKGWNIIQSLSGSSSDEIQKALEKAVDVIVRSQNPGGGWRYQPQADGGEDTSCTQTVFHCLASARQAGILVPQEVITKVGKYLKGAQNAESGGFTYAPNGRANVSFACSAGGTYSAQLAGLRDSEMVTASLRYMKKQFPAVITKGAGHYYYSHYYAIQAMVQAGDEYYAEWYPVIRDALVTKQGENGSWHGKKGNTSHETPMAIIILATPHRYIPIYQR